MPCRCEVSGYFFDSINTKPQQDFEKTGRKFRLFYFDFSKFLLYYHNIIQTDSGNPTVMNWLIPLTSPQAALNILS